MSVDLWLIEANNGVEWTFDELEINGRKRDSYHWLKEIVKKNFITKKSIAENDNLKNNDQSGNTISFLNCSTVPNNSDPETSAINIIVSSRSSSNTFTYGSL